MENKEVTMELILSVFKNYSDKKRIKEIKEAIISMLYPDNLLIDVKERDSVEKQVVELISKDKKLESESELIYSSGKYGKRKKKRYSLILLIVNILERPENVPLYQNCYFLDIMQIG